MIPDADTPRDPYTYVCLCGQRATVAKEQTREWRLWGQTEYAPHFRHQCPACGRANYVHGGMITLSIPLRSSEKEMP